MIRIRRMSVGLFVFAGLTVMGLAVSEHANGQGKADKADKAKPDDVPKLVPGGRMDWNKTKIAFGEMSGKDWPSIFQWLADKSGMPFSSQYKVTGTFSFIPPKDKKYTLIEIYDIINEVLQTQHKFALLRSEVTLSLVPADDPIPGSLLPGITLKQLPERGRTEIVELTFKLRSGLDAQEIAADVKRQLGAFGSVTPLPTTNELIVQGVVATLRRVVPRYAAGLDGEDPGKNDHTLAYKCKFVRASTAELVISKALGAQTIVQFKGPGGAPPDGSNPDPGGKGGKGGGGGVKQVRPHTVVSDRQTNTVFVTGPQAKLDEAKAILATLDKGKGPGDKGLLPTSPHQFLNHELPLGGADAMAKMLNEIYRTDDSIRIQVASPSRLFVWADPQTHFEIKGIITVPAPIVVIDTVVIPLLRNDAGKFVLTLKDMFPNSKNGSPFIDADTDQNAIRLRGTPDEIKDVRTVIRILDGSPGDLGGHIRMINLDKGSGATVSEATFLLLAKLRPDINVKLELPGQLDDAFKVDWDKKTPAKSDVKPSEPIPAPKMEPGTNPFKKKPMARMTPDKLREVMYSSDLTPTSHVLYDSQEQKGPDPKGIAKDEDEPKKKKKGSITISGFGNRIIITGDDPEALDLAHQMIRILVNTEAGPGDFEVLNLRWASAVEVAKILDEAFNGPKTQGGGGGGGRPGGGLQLPGIGGMMGGLLGIGGGGQPGRNEIIRVVADAATNSLLIRAKPIDMLTIRRLIARQLDVRNVDSENLARTFIIGPLKNATAVNVAEIIEHVYRDAMANRNSNTISQTSPGFQFFQQQRSSEPVAGGQRASLSVGVDNTTNSLVVQCSTTMYGDVKKLVDELDTVAGSNKQVVRVISLQDIDPAIAQQVVDAISGKTAASRQGQGGQANNAPGAFGTPGRTFGNQGFGGGNQGFGGGGAGNFGGFPGGGIQGVFPGGGTPGFNPGGGGGGGPRTGPGGGGGGKGGGTRPGGRSLERGPDFFVSRVMDDPSRVLFDPSEEQDEFEPRPNDRFILRPAYSANPLLVSLQENQPSELLASPKGKDDVNAPRLPVQIEPIPSLGVIIVRAQNEADMLAVMRILDLVRKSSQPALIEIELVPVRFGDPTQIVNQLNQLFGKVILGTSFTEIAGGARLPGGGTGPGFGQQPVQAGAALQPTNIVLLPQQRLGAILVAASKARMPDIKKQIQLLDQPHSDTYGVKTYPLKRAAAARVAKSLNDFYATRMPQEIGTAAAPPFNNQIRIGYDDGTNSVIVQASPADLKEIDRIIGYIDTAPNGSKADIRVVPLRNAVASDLASLLQVSIANGVLTLNTVQTTVVAQPGAGAGGGAANLQAFGQVVPMVKDITLRLVPSKSKDGKMFETRILEDIRIYADIRTNSLVVTAPSESMELVLALIRDLDVQPNARSEINIFTLKKSDATQLAIMLQQLFLGSGGVGAKAVAGGGAAAGGATAPKPLSFSIQTTTPEGAPIIDLRVTVDERTNSLIVAGSQNDLRVVETIIARIEDANVPERRNEAIRLRNSQAVDVANAVSLYLTNYQKIYQTYGQETNSLGLARDVIVVAEPVSNSLLISATPKMFDEIIGIISKIDTAPAQVVIQVLIAEVTMNGSEEFGMEIGLQNPLSFMRGFLPGTSTPIYATTGTGTNPTGTIGVPGFFFNNPPTNPPGNSPGNPSAFGLAGTTNLGVGRVSPINNVPGFVFSANADVVSVLIRALKVQGRLNVLSRPQLMTLDNQTGIIQVVTNTPIIQGSAVVSATGVVTNPPIVPVALGITLQVTPRITPDGRVIMRVIPEVSAVDRTDFPLGNGQVSTSYKTQHLETTVAASDGETILLGGLITKRDEKNENKVPWLGDLPGIGAAFRYRNYTKTKTELVIIMTPHIIRNRYEMEQLKNDELRRISWSLGDVNRVHGDGFMDGPGCQPAAQPFRIYRDGRSGSGSGSAEYVPQAAAPVNQTPLPVASVPVQTAPMPIEAAPQPAKAPFLKGGLIQSMMNKRPAETVVYEPQPMMQPTPMALPTVQYAPVPQPLPQVISAGNPPSGSMVTIPAVNNFNGPNGR